MPILGSFSNKTFSVSMDKIYTFDELTINSELKFEEQEVEGSKPSTYIKGAGLDKFSFTISLIKQKKINIENEIKDWLKIRDSKTPHYLIIGGKSVSNYKLLLTNIDVNDTTIGVNGEYLKAKIQLQFLEYVRAGKKQDTDQTSSSKPPSTSKNSKKSKKRSNKNSKNTTTNTNKSNVALEALEKELYG